MALCGEHCLYVSRQIWTSIHCCERRSIEDETGPIVAKIVYRELFGKEVIDPEDIPYALDMAVRELRRRGYRPHQWAPFIHLGA